MLPCGNPPVIELTNQKAAMCHPVIAQSNWSNLVKQSTLVKNWSKERDLTANIDIFGCLCKIGLQN